MQSNNGVKIPGAGPNVPTGGGDQVWWDWNGGSGLQDPNEFGAPHPFGTGRSPQFIKCAQNAGLGSFLNDTQKYFSDWTFNHLNKIAETEGVSRELLAFTYAAESGFQEINTPPNPNYTKIGKGRKAKKVASKFTNWDYGPFQINYKWMMRMLAKNEILAKENEIKSGKVSIFYSPKTQKSVTCFVSLTNCNELRKDESLEKE